VTGPMPVPEGARVGAAAAFLRRAIGADRCDRIASGLVLGSGLQGFGRELEQAVEIPFAAVPEWPAPRTKGHGQSLLVGTLGGAGVACLTGRVHLYEGWSPAEVVRPLRTLRALGVDTFLLTNAAGGIADELSPGDLMVISDHLNLTGSSPLLGPEDPVLGPRFPDQSRVWHPDLRSVLRAIRPGMAEGVYAGLLGPSYETPAEIRMLRTLGADAVGMSTVHEAIALNAMGARVAGLSLISNLAAGIAGRPLNHDVVIAAGATARAALAPLLSGFCARVGR
jgi:purine-nucleoside phosphorylase